MSPLFQSLLAGRGSSFFWATAQGNSLRQASAFPRRFLSNSAILRSGRPNWYQGRPVQTIRSGPLTKLQNAIDRRIPRSWLLYGIIGINGAVFAAWSYADNAARRFRDWGPLQFMYQNFAASWGNILRPWTLVTSCFSHRDTSHIFVNLLSFYFMAPAALSILTASQFLGLYLLAGLAGNAVQLTSFLINRDGRIPSFALGASGAINGVLAFYAAAFPRQKLLLMFVLPVPAWIAVGGLVCYDMYLAFLQPNGTVGAAAHLGGVAGGVLYFLSLRSRGRLPRFY